MKFAFLLVLLLALGLQRCAVHGSASYESIDESLDVNDDIDDEIDEYGDDDMADYDDEDIEAAPKVAPKGPAAAGGSAKPASNAAAGPAGIHASAGGSMGGSGGSSWGSGGSWGSGSWGSGSGHWDRPKAPPPFNSSLTSLNSDYYSQLSSTITAYFGYRLNQSLMFDLFSLGPCTSAQRAISAYDRRIVFESYFFNFTVNDPLLLTQTQVGMVNNAHSTALTDVYNEHIQGLNTIQDMCQSRYNVYNINHCDPQSFLDDTCDYDINCIYNQAMLMQNDYITSVTASLSSGAAVDAADTIADQLLVVGCVYAIFETRDYLQMNNFFTCCNSTSPPTARRLLARCASS